MNSPGNQKTYFNGYFDYIYCKKKKKIRYEFHNFKSNKAFSSKCCFVVGVELKKCIFKSQYIVSLSTTSILIKY